MLIAVNVVAVIPVTPMWLNEVRRGWLRCHSPRTCLICCSHSALFTDSSLLHPFLVNLLVILTARAHRYGTREQRRAAEQADREELLSRGEAGRRAKQDMDEEAQVLSLG